MRIPSPRTSSPNVVLAILSLGIFSAAIDQTVIYGALNDIMFDVHMNISDLDRASWIVIAYLIGYTSVLPLAGRLSDVFGPARVYIFGNLVFIAASGFIVSVDSFNLMIAARVVQAVGGGAIVPAALAIVAGNFPGRRRAIAFGIIGGAVELGAAVGPTFGGAVAEYMGWRWIFWIDVIIGAVVIAMIYFMVRNTPGIRRPVDYRGALMIAVSLSLLSLGLSQQFHRPNAELYMAGYLIGAALFAGLFIRRTLKNRDPLFGLSMFRRTGFSAANTTHLLVGGALIIALVVVPVMGYTLMGLGDVEVGLRLLRLTLAIPVGAVIGGFVCHRFGYRPPTTAGLLLAGTGLFLMSRWGETIVEPTQTIHLVIAGLGFGLVIAPITTAAVDAFGPDRRGIASALVTSTRLDGMVIGLSFMNSLGMGSYHVAAEDLSIDELDQLTPFALDLFQDFFFAAAVVCLVAILPAFWMRRVRDG